MPLCVLGGGKAVALALTGFTLAWTHTVERIPWEEGWRIEQGRLVLETSRIKGSGAGMESPPEARLVDGWYVWHPDETRQEVVLRRMPGLDDWRFCPRKGGRAAAGCRPLGEILDADPVTLKACDTVPEPPRG